MILEGGFVNTKNNDLIISYEDYQEDVFFDPLTHKYFHNLEEYEQYYQTHTNKPTNVAMACEKVYFSIGWQHINYIVENQLGLCGEDKEMCDVVDLDGLYNFLEEWNQKQNLYYYVVKKPNIIILLSGEKNEKK